jgi:hypothetical protein
VDSSARRPDLASLSCSYHESRLDLAALGSRRTSGDRGLSIRLGGEMEGGDGGYHTLLVLASSWLQAASGMLRAGREAMEETIPSSPPPPRAFRRRLEFPVALSEGVTLSVDLLYVLLRS